MSKLTVESKDGTTIAFERAGTGPVVILVGGGLTDRSELEPLVPALAGQDAHVGEWGLGSVSETADGAAPHGATGCPFQAWSVAELLRIRTPTTTGRLP